MDQDEGGPKKVGHLNEAYDEKESAPHFHFVVSLLALFNKIN